jgi:quinol monooxygenase YgiN
MIIVTGSIRIPADKIDRALPVMQALVAQTLKEDGCIAYAFGRDVADPERVLISEAWRDEAALGAHFNAPHFAAWRDQNEALGVTDRKLTVYDATVAKEL